jgi:hypothetical protein
MQLKLAITVAAILLLQGCPVYQFNRLPESSPLSQPVFISTSSSAALLTRRRSLSFRRPSAASEELT